MKTLWEKLAKPFDEKEIEWRCGATNKDKTKCLALPYITNRAIQKRLDAVLGAENWYPTFRDIDGGFVCTLSIRVGEEWIHKQDGAKNTNFEAIKGGISDSMKRAAVQYGIGRYLYEAEAIWSPAKNVGKSTILVGTPELKLKGTGTKVAEAENIPTDTPTEPEADKAIQVAIKKLRASETLDELGSIWETLGSLKADPEVFAMKEEIKREFTV